MHVQCLCLIFKGWGGEQKEKKEFFSLLFGEHVLLCNFGCWEYGYHIIPSSVSFYMLPNERNLNLSILMWFPHFILPRYLSLAHSVLLLVFDVVVYSGCISIAFYCPSWTKRLLL